MARLATSCEDLGRILPTIFGNRDQASPSHGKFWSLLSQTSRSHPDRLQMQHWL